MLNGFVMSIANLIIAHGVRSAFHSWVANF